MVSGTHVQKNLMEVERWISLAAEYGAELLVLPENFAFMGFDEQARVALAEEPGKGMMQDFIAQVANKYHVWIVAGTIPLRGKNPHKVRSACIVYDAEGKQRARYDKIHLFDVTVEDTKKIYFESKTTEAGDLPVVIDTPFGRLGLAVCYDIRFPELFRQLIEQSAELFAVPSAFTKVTGRAHWKVLLRARAVENLCFVLAAAQGGIHENGRETYGHSIIINPWGETLNSHSRGPGLVLATIDRAQQQKLRQDFPVLMHRRHARPLSP